MNFRITKTRAAEIAKKACTNENWTWIEPVSIDGGLFGLRRRWIVRTNSRADGCNATVVISKLTGEVVGKGYIPR